MKNATVIIGLGLPFLLIYSFLVYCRGCRDEVRAEVAKDNAVEQTQLAKQEAARLDLHNDNLKTIAIWQRNLTEACTYWNTRPTYRKNVQRTQKKFAAELQFCCDGNDASSCVQNKIDAREYLHVASNGDIY